MMNGLIGKKKEAFRLTDCGSPAIALAALLFLAVLVSSPGPPVR